MLTRVARLFNAVLGLRECGGDGARTENPLSLGKSRNARLNEAKIVDDDDGQAFFLNGIRPM